MIPPPPTWLKKASTDPTGGDCSGVTGGLPQRRRQPDRLQCTALLMSGSWKLRQPAPWRVSRMAKYEAKGGTSGDIVITVWDSLGNKTEYNESDGYHARRKYPGDQQFVPHVAETAPKDADNEDAPTVNLFTKNPAFQYRRRAGFAVHTLSLRRAAANGHRAGLQPGQHPGWRRWAVWSTGR